MQSQQEIVALTKALIRIPSVHSRPHEIRRCADYIEAWLGERSIDYQRKDINGTPSLLVLPKPDHMRVLYMAHFDVVEVDDEGLFDPREEKGRLYGRGAIDDKYAVALSLVLFHEHLKAMRTNGKDQADMRFGLLLTGDEEVGGANGAGAALKTLTPDFFVALDGGGPKRVVIREKGVLQLELDTRGKAAHGARPWLGENAFDRLVADYAAIRRLFDADDCSNDAHWHKTLVLSNCRAGDGSVNKVPDLASATLDIRYTETENPEALVNAIRAVVVHSTVTVRAQVPLFVSGESAYLDLLLKMAGEVATVSEHGASDARYPSERGIPGVVWGAEGEMSQHSAEEHLVVASLGQIYDCLHRFQQAVEAGAWRRG